jgi:hypothetical protein
MIDTLTPAEINAIDEAANSHGVGFFSTYPEYRQIVTDARTVNGVEAFFVATNIRQSDPYDDATRYVRYRVYSIELTDGLGCRKGHIEQLMGDYRTQAEAEAIVDQYIAHDLHRAAIQGR